jgi:hypothetical protein
MTLMASTDSTDRRLPMALLSRLTGATPTRPLRVLGCRPINEGTFPSQLVECRRGRGRILRLFCKHGTGVENTGHGHRGGPPYEAQVYRYLADASASSLPPFRGSYDDPKTGGAWIVLDFLHGCQRIHLTCDPGNAMVLAAEWAGQFHTEQSASVKAAFSAGISCYDRSFYQGWARRTRRFARPQRERFPWLDRLCRRFETLIDELIAAPQTVIHGEYYPKNILLHEGKIIPVDWESAAIGPGMIDLASLTEGWTRDVTNRCEQAYRRAYQPGTAEPDFERRLALARVYLHLRWLGDRADWTSRPSSIWHFRKLRTLGSRLGILE